MNVIQGRFGNGAPRSRDGTLFGVMYEGILRRWHMNRGNCEYAATQYVQELRHGRSNEVAWRILRDEIAIALLTHSGDKSRRHYEDMRTLVETAARR